MSKMTGALSHLSSARLAAREAVDSSLSRIHQAAQLWSSTFHRFRVLDASFSSNRHLFLSKERKLGKQESS